MAPEDLPQDKYGVMTYCEGIHFAQTGREQQFRMAISHDESVQRLLHRLSQVEAEFQFSLHPHQTFKQSVVCWLGGSNKWNHLGRLEPAIYNNSAWAPLRVRGVKVECSYDVVRVRPGENVDFQ